MAERTISTRFAIAGEAEYKNAVKGINNELKTLSSEMAKSKSEFQTQANSVQALSQKGDILGRQYEAQARKVDQMRAALENSRSAQEQYGAALEQQNAHVESLKERLEALKQAEGDTAAEQEKLTAELERAEQAQDAAQRAYDQAGKSVDYWQRSLNYAERDLNNLNTEIQTNDQYLKEAQQSANGCASSIDQYGKAMGEAGGATNALGQIGQAVFGNLGGLMGAGGLAGFAVNLIGTVKELAVEFNASQSSMAISTGATGEDLQALNEGLTEVMATAKSARGDVAGVMGSLYTQMGLRGYELKQHTAEVEEFSRAVNADMGQAVGVVTELLLAYGKRADELPAILDRLTVAHQNSRSGALSLAQSVSDASFYADAYNMSLDEVLSMMTAFDLAGVDSNLVLRAMRKSYDDLAEGGMTLSQVFEGMRDGTISEGDAIEMFGQKADKMVKYIRNGTVDITKYVDLLENSEGAAAKGAQAAETFGQQIKGLWNSIWNGEAIGSQYTGFYETVTEQSGEIVESQEAVGRSLRDVGNDLLAMVDGFDGTSGALDRMIAFLQDSDNQILTSREGYGTFVDTLKELRLGYEQMEAEQEKVAAAVHKSVESVTANFNDLSNVTAKDVQDMIKALASQEKYMQDYASNMQAAAKRGVNEGLLKSLRDGSTQSAEILAGLATATDEQIDELNAQWEKTEKGKETFESTLLDMQGEFDKRAAELEGRFKTAVDNFNRESDALAAGSKTLQGAIDGALLMEGPLVSTMSRIGANAYNAFAEQMRKIEQYGAPGSGYYPPTGGSLPMTGGTGEIVSSIRSVEDAIRHGQPVSTIRIDAFSRNIDSTLAHDLKMSDLAGG